jgi:hypothetical protein
MSKHPLRVILLKFFLSNCASATFISLYGAVPKIISKQAFRESFFCYFYIIASLEAIQKCQSS